MKKRALKVKERQAEFESRARSLKASGILAHLMLIESTMRDFSAGTVTITPECGLDASEAQCINALLSRRAAVRKSNDKEVNFLRFRYAMERAQAGVSAEEIKAAWKSKTVPERREFIAKHYVPAAKKKKTGEGKKKDGASSPTKAPAAAIASTTAASAST